MIQLGLKLPLLLQPAEQREGHGQGSNGLQTLCRGMCLSEEYTSIVSVGRVPLPGGAVGGWGPLWGLLPGGYAVAPYPVQLGPSQTDVTAILVCSLLAGLAGCAGVWLLLAVDQPSPASGMLAQARLGQGSGAASQCSPC